MNKSINKNYVKAALQTPDQIDLSPVILSKIRSGQLKIAAKDNFTILRILVLLSLGASLVLNIIALYFLVQTILQQSTLGFIEVIATNISTYQNLAWSALLESVPWLMLGFFVLTLLDLFLVLGVRSRFKKNNLLI